MFPSSTGRALSNAILSKLLRDLNVDGVPHGFRSSFRDWTARNTLPIRDRLLARLPLTSSLRTRHLTRDDRENEPELVFKQSLERLDVRDRDVVECLAREVRKQMV